MGRTTICIQDETKKRFIKVRGALESKNGKPRTEDTILNDLITFFERPRPLKQLERVLILLGKGTIGTTTGNIEEAYRIVEKLIESEKK